MTISPQSFFRRSHIRTTGALLGATTVAAASGSAALLAILASPASAVATLTVDTTADGAATASDCTTPVTGSCSLRDALAAAANGDTITFDPTVFTPGSLHTITMDASQGAFGAPGDITITGPGSNVLAIDAGTSPSTILNFTTAGQTVSISGATLTGGDGHAHWGAAFAFTGAVTISDLTVAGTSTLYGAISALQVANITISDSTVSNNLTQTGAAIMIRATGASTVRNTTIANNSASSFGVGALYLGSGSATVTLDNSTLTGNQGAIAGAVLVGSASSFIANQSTITNNTALYSDNRSGGGITGVQSPPITLSGTIVSGNHAGIATFDDLGSGSYAMTIAVDHSLIGVIDPLVTMNGTYVHSSTPMLDPLANNGGSTQTMALQAGSPAIDAGPNPVATFTGNTYDQRGAGYDRVVGGTVDIGAFEVQAPVPPTTSSTTTSTTSTSTTSTIAPTTTTDPGGGGALPSTGSDSTDLLIGGAFLLIGGGAAAIVANRRSAAMPAWKHRR